MRVDDLEAGVRAEVVRLAGEVEGTVGIVVPAARRVEVERWLAGWSEVAEEAPNAGTGRDTSNDRIVVLTGLDTKGLEFDGIVVVRPQEIEDEASTGKATLYVVLTRATQLLSVVS